MGTPIAVKINRLRVSTADATPVEFQRDTSNVFDSRHREILQYGVLAYI